MSESRWSSYQTVEPFKLSDATSDVEFADWQPGRRFLHPLEAAARVIRTGITAAGTAVLVATSPTVITLHIPPGYPVTPSATWFIRPQRRRGISLSEARAIAIRSVERAENLRALRARAEAEETLAFQDAS
jgi:hypothetical protein